jgi:hypothetical protein
MSERVGVSIAFQGDPQACTYQKIHLCRPLFSTLVR